MKYYKVKVFAYEEMGITDFIVQYSEQYSVADVGSALRADISEVCKVSFPTFAFIEISEKRALKEQKKGVLIL